MFGCCVCLSVCLVLVRMEAKNQSRISRGNENPSNRRRTTNKQEDDEDEAQILEIEPDRISELPDSLLIHILSLLPSLNHVIRTGTLSKRWLRLWTFVPNLVFSPLANVLFPDLYSSARFVYNVHRTLVQSRVSKIEKFSVQIPYCAPLKPVVDSWVHFVTTNNIDDLSLRFINLKLGDFYILPQNLCTSSSLKVLELKNCAFAPVGLISWNSLRSLSLKCMNLSNGVLEGILSGCPVLEILEVLYYYGLSRLKVTSPSLRELVMSDFKGSFDKDNHHHRDAYLAISAPNLRMLTISSCFYTWNVRLEDVKSLVVADLSFYLDIDDSVYDNVEEYEKYGDLLQELIEKLHHVKELKLGQWCIQVLSVLELKGLPSPLLSCKSLKLDLQVANDDLPGIAKVLEISPYLETLLISNSLEFFVGGCLFDADSFEGENYLQLRQTIPKGFLLHLKNVKIFGFRREHCEVELVEFLLKNAKALENMNIHLQREDVPWQSEYSVWGEIGNGELNLPASSATIRFFASPENSCETMLLRV